MDCISRDAWKRLPQPILPSAKTDQVRRPAGGYDWNARGAPRRGPSGWGSYTMQRRSTISYHMIQYNTIQILKLVYKYYKYKK